VTRAIDVRGAFRIYESEARATVALAGLDLAIEAGEVVVAFGPSGSGKTTLLRVVGGLERLSAGSARVLDVELARATAREAAIFRTRNLGLLEQHYARALPGDLSCLETVALRRRLAGEPAGKARTHALRLLERVGLADRAHERPVSLSGGEQQRVAVCAALAHDPPLLLADEPAGELDAASAAAVYELLRSLARDRGTTALVVSHDREATAIADRVIHIRDGRVVAEGRHDGAPRLVVSPNGWLQLPRDVLRGPNRAAVERRQDEIILRPADAQTFERATHPPPVATRPTAVVAELRAVEKRFPAGADERVVLRGFSRSFRAATLTAVVGRSGSGKTTLLHLLAGLERPTAGEVIVAGERLDGRTRAELADLRRRHVALVAQEAGLVPYLSAIENVELALALRQLANGGRARDSLTSVGLAEHLDRRVSLLSAGERERVAIARALAVGSTLLLVDEPTARLDEETARDVGELLARAARERGLAVVCATHDPALVRHADDVVELAS
jgi:ABC-type lipoprotein export system ATPase subunit